MSDYIYIINKLHAEIAFLEKKKTMVEEATFSTELLEMKRQYIQLINSVIEDSNTLVTKLKCGDIMHERLLNVSGKLKLAPNKVQIFEAKSEEQC